MKKLTFQCIRCPESFEHLKDLVDHCEKAHGLELDVRYRKYLTEKAGK